MERILITGTGLIASELAKMLSEAGYSVSFLSTSKKEHLGFTCYQWNPSKNKMDDEALSSVDHIIHLAGTNIAQNWTQSAKKEIINSRVQTANLIFNRCKQLNTPPKTFITASGSNYYGVITDNQPRTEDDSPGKGFVSDVCVQWENAAQQFEAINTRVVALRTGVVLSPGEGALEKMEKPMKFGFGAALGSGKQYMPWIHLTDICSMYLHAIRTSDMSGPYNAVATEKVTNKEFTKALAKAMNKKLWLPNVPSFLLKLVFGEMAKIVLEGVPLSNNRIISSGYQFKYDQLDDALNDLYK